MAIDHCKSHDLEWNRDDYTECPRCPTQAEYVVSMTADEAAALMKVEVVDTTADLIRDLSEGYPWQAKDAELHKRVKRLLGSA